MVKEKCLKILNFQIKIFEKTKQILNNFIKQNKCQAYKNINSKYMLNKKFADNKLKIQEKIKYNKY